MCCLLLNKIVFLFSSLIFSSFWALKRLIKFCLSEYFWILCEYFLDTDTLSTTFPAKTSIESWKREDQCRHQPDRTQKTTSKPATLPSQNCEEWITRRRRQSPSAQRSRQKFSCSVKEPLHQQCQVSIINISLAGKIVISSNLIDSLPKLIFLDFWGTILTSLVSFWSIFATLYGDVSTKPHLNRENILNISYFSSQQTEDYIIANY